MINVLLFESIAHAHAVSEAPPGFFVIKWPWDPTVLFFLALAILYARGLREYGGHAPVQRWQIVSFFVGIATLLAASLPPIDPVADQLFCAHMLQHLLITAVGVPLIMLGAPFFVALRGWPARVRRAVAVPFLQNHFVRAANGFTRLPLAALAIFEAAFWFWHVPKFYDAALRNDVIHLVEHACMAFGAMAIWRLLIDPAPLQSPLALPTRFLFLLLLMTLDMALSAALTFSSNVWYAYDQLPLPQWWSWDRLQDQRLGGLLMWVPGSAVWLIALIATFTVWFRRETARV